MCCVEDRRPHGQVNAWRSPDARCHMILFELFFTRQITGLFQVIELFKKKNKKKQMVKK